MRHKTTFFLGILLLLVLLAYFVTFQVNFNEVVVLTTFGRADAESVYRGGDDAGGALGNLHFKWPPPIQMTTSYDQRVRVLEDRLEEQQTADKKSIIVSTYIAWRIDDALSFFKTLRHEETAEEQIRTRLRDARSVIGRFTMDELTNANPDNLKLAEAEQAIAQKLQSELAGQGYGVKIESVGIKRIVLPQSVAQKVFEQMRKKREALAQAARSEGTAHAATIRADAESAADRILSFANARAQSIRAEGARAAAEYYKAFQQNEEFAIFLAKLDAYKEIFGHNTTFIIDAKQGGLGAEFYQGPIAPGTTAPGAAPGIAQPQTNGTPLPPPTPPAPAASSADRR